VEGKVQQRPGGTKSKIPFLGGKKGTRVGTKRNKNAVKNLEEEELQKKKSGSRQVQTR